MDLILPIEFPKLPKIEDEYKPMIKDIVKLLVILLTMNLLYYFLNSNNELVSKQFVNIISFVILGLVTYWLLIDKLLSKALNHYDNV